MKLRRPWVVGAPVADPVLLAVLVLRGQPRDGDQGRERRDEALALTLCLVVGAWVLSWAGVFVSNTVLALALLLLGVAALIAASVLMQQRLTRLWTVVAQPPVAQVV
jgi:hypothetical protein